jgi:hypothetical protein
MCGPRFLFVACFGGLASASVGADDPHWAFQAPRLPDVPSFGEEVPDFSVRTPIDAFVLAALRERGWSPALPATREEWLRRVTFDVTGLPPTLWEIDDFLEDSDPGAADRVVDRLMASPSFGEHLAVEWLDAARYGDTYGRGQDFDAPNWPWRDWVIDALNRNLPYDHFVLLQTAGDLLPGAGSEEIVPTAFNRLHLLTNEAGSDPEAFRQEAVADRVATNGCVFLGLTLECARCHDHKHDPITTREFYALAAFFDRIDELGLYTRFTTGIPPPTILLSSEAQQARQVQSLKEAKLPALRSTALARFHRWLETNRPPVANLTEAARRDFQNPDARPRTGQAMAQPVDAYDFDRLDNGRELANTRRRDRPGRIRGPVSLVEGKPGHGKALGFSADRDASAILPGAGDFGRTDTFTLSVWVKTERVLDEGPILHRTRSAVEAAHRGYELSIEQGRVVFRLAHFWPGNAIAIRTREPLKTGVWTHLAAAYDGSSRADGLTLFVNGNRAECEILRDRLDREIRYLPEWGDFDPEKVTDAALAGEVELAIGGRFNAKSFRDGAIDGVRVYDCCLTSAEIAALHDPMRELPDSEWFDWYLREIDGPWRAAITEIRRLRESENQHSIAASELMVMRDMDTPRVTRVLEKGRPDLPGEVVEPGIPSALGSWPADYPRDRLGLARWLTDGGNPLTSRVVVNRIWTRFFGRGLVATVADFGRHGEAPSHPALLDWLALHFQNDLGWDVKALCREIALSSTYRQSSLVRAPAWLAIDPENRFLARGPRRRLGAEEIRDQALSVSGMLSQVIGGPSVKPPQPAALWESSGIQHRYRADEGEPRYRRGLYTFWRRTLPPPAFSLFDAPSRETCQIGRPQSHNPLQALALLNDPQLTESARVLAERLVRAHPTQDSARVVEAFRTLTGATPRENQTVSLIRLLADARAHFEKEPGSALRLVRESGDYPVVPGLSPVEVAATTCVVRILIGYDGAATVR